MILHTVNKSALSHDALQRCLAVMGNGDTLLFIEDGVYAALESVRLSGDLKTKIQVLLRDGRLMVLSEDVLARGLQNKLLSGIASVDYAGFVELVTKHQSSVAWF